MLVATEMLFISRATWSTGLHGSGMRYAAQHETVNNPLFMCHVLTNGEHTVYV